MVVKIAVVVVVVIVVMLAMIVVIFSIIFFSLFWNIKYSKNNISGTVNHCLVETSTKSASPRHSQCKDSSPPFTYLNLTQGECIER